MVSSLASGYSFNCKNSFIRFVVNLDIIQINVVLVL